MLLTIFKQFSNCMFGLKLYWNILFQGGILIEVKVILGIFESNNITFFIENENNMKFFSRGWGFSVTYLFF